MIRFCRTSLKSLTAVILTLFKLQRDRGKLFIYGMKYLSIPSSNSVSNCILTAMNSEHYKYKKVKDKIDSWQIKNHNWINVLVLWKGSQVSKWTFKKEKSKMNDLNTWCILNIFNKRNIFRFEEGISCLIFFTSF